MMRWLERLAVAVVVVLTIGTLLACWMPAYVGVPDENNRRAQRWHRPR